MDEILDGQMSLFDSEKVKLKNNPIRLIELFAGIGAQASALKRVFDNCELYKIAEWEVNAVASYKAIHIDDNTDYSKDLTDEQIDDALIKFGISTDGKIPLTDYQIRRKQQKWKRETYNNFIATNNIGSIVKAKGSNLGIIDTDNFTYLLTYLLTHSLVKT